MVIKDAIKRDRDFSGFCAALMLLRKPLFCKESHMNKTATITYDGKTYEFPLVVGTEGEEAIDISTLRSRTGLITLDPGFANRFLQVLRRGHLFGAP